MVAHKLFPALSLESALELIDLSEHFWVHCDLFFDLLHATYHRRVIAPVEDPRDHRIGVVVQEVSNQVHGDVPCVHQRSQTFRTTNVLD